MIRRIIITPLLGVLLAAGLALVGPASTPAAEAAITKNGCATRAEWRKIKRSTPLSRARSIIGHRGRLTDSTEYSDGDEYRTYKFRQCGRSWWRSSLYLTVSLSEKRYWVDESYWDPCYDWDYDNNCFGEWVEDGYYETYYDTPFRVRSKYAYWA